MEGYMTDFYAIGAEYASKFEDRKTAWEYALVHDERVLSALADHTRGVSPSSDPTDPEIRQATPHLAEHSSVSDAEENFARGFHRVPHRTLK